MQDEKSLVSRAQNGDEIAFSRLYEEYFERIYRYVVVRMGDRMEAEDLTQQVFLKALQSIGSFKWKGAPFSSWLYRIAHNQVVDYLRKSKRRVSVPIDELTLADTCDPQADAEKRAGVGQLSDCIQRLTESQREVISLRFTSELPIAEVARIMNKTEGAIKALQHSAIVALRKAMAEV